MKKISPDDLLPLDEFEKTHPIKIDLVYARDKNFLGRAIYRPNARMWGHKDLVTVTLAAAEMCYKETGYIFELKDCLRTTDAQARMLETDIAKKNPEWFVEPRLLSPPGRGAHPRAMAIDMMLVDQNGDAVDMGTPFDFLPEDKNHNPSARHYTNFPEQILENRRLLESVLQRAAEQAGIPLQPYPQEWWDFRFMPDYTNSFAPLSDADLPPEMRMCG